MIGAKTAEYIKFELGSAIRQEEKTVSVYGRHVVTGLPTRCAISSDVVYECMKEFINQIIDSIKSILERTPPELSADILDRGIVLTGGGALLRGLEELIEEKTGINTMTAEDPMKVVAVGTGQFVEFMSGRKEA